ncbi:hypothetical protein GmHk_02G004967 [Glycine max]|nr:hypothetical protein GmHk_02G004967 [Glycine max]
MGCNRLHRKLCNSSFGTGNRLPERKSLEKDILTMRSRYGTHCIIAMAAQLIHDCVVMECLEGVWETHEGNERCQFRGTIRLTTTSLPVEWILPTPTPYRLVEPAQVIEVSSSEEDPEEDPEELPPEPADDEDPLPDVDSPKDIMSASEADSIEESDPRGTASSEDSSS